MTVGSLKLKQKLGPITKVKSEIINYVTNILFWKQSYPRQLAEDWDLALASCASFFLPSSPSIFTIQSQSRDLQFESVLILPNGSNLKKLLQTINLLDILHFECKSVTMILHDLPEEWNISCWKMLELYFVWAYLPRKNIFLQPVTDDWYIHTITSFSFIFLLSLSLELSL